MVFGGDARGEMERWRLERRVVESRRGEETQLTAHRETVNESRGVRYKPAAGMARYTSSKAARGACACAVWYNRELESGDVLTSQCLYGQRSIVCLIAAEGLYQKLPENIHSTSHGGHEDKNRF